MTWTTRALSARPYHKESLLARWPIDEVGRCGLTASNLELKRAWFQRLKPKSDEPLSHFAFNFNLRRYNEVTVRVAAVIHMQKGEGWNLGRAAQVEPS
jgi:hypothetical protein